MFWPWPHQCTDEKFEKTGELNCKFHCGKVQSPMLLSIEADLIQIPVP